MLLGLERKDCAWPLDEELLGERNLQVSSGVTWFLFAALSNADVDIRFMDDDVTDKLMKIVRRKQLLKIAKDLKNPESIRLVRSINNEDSNSFDFVHEILESLK